MAPRAKMNLSAGDSEQLERVILQITGRTIVNCGTDEAQRGFHLELDDGRVLIIQGPYLLVGIYERDERVLQ